MNDKTYDGPCKLCGYSDDDPFIPTYLEPKTLLSDRYIVGRLLSYNGEGATYIGYDKAAGTKVTIKEFMPDTLCSRKKGETEIVVNSKNSPLYKTYLSEFEDLNRTLMKLHGMTHIQAVLDVFLENNTCYAVFEFINGISLKTFLANSTGGLTWDQVKELFPPIFTTLSLAHQAGIIHRGISPQTIFVTDKMELKLTNFCISAARTTNTEIACEIFNGYAAPEQYADDRMNGTWTDVYGIAAVLYRVLTGTAPKESTSAAIVDMPEPMLVNRNVPTNVSKVIMHGMVSSPEQRTRSINDFVSRLFTPPKYSPAKSSAGSEGASPERVSPRVQKRLKKQEKERRKAIIVLAIAGVVLITFAIVFAIAMNGGFAPKPNEESSTTSTTTSTSSSKSTTTTTTTSTEPESSEPTSSEPLVIERILVPDFTDRKYQQTLEQYAGMFTFVPDFVYSDTHKRGYMYEQDIDEGEMLPRGSEIKVKVSNGPSAVPLPSYENIKGTKYAETLTELGIQFEIEEDYDWDVPEGYVIECNKDIGDIIDVKGGEKVIVYVSLGDD
ncbi:MAG: PASTA domain-containing protein [Oscillospiraceae bacterium]|nr:PASTA domain-containing protein [Oscillospiraceae bacterium]